VWCRGKLWEPIFAKWFAGRCQLCAYSCQPPEGRRRRDALAGWLTMLLCTNHPDSPGKLREVLPTDRCRNFKARLWQPPIAKWARRTPDVAVSESDGRVRRIPLTQGLFAVVDARDYKKLSKYKWCASRRGRNIYACAYVGRKYVTMHRFIVKPPKGMVVHHIDGNGLNNRRCNLRVCTDRQHRVSRSPRGGASRFVGVTRHKNKWQAGLGYRGGYLYLGLFDDEVEAAKVRDRKAYELHGDLAFLNFPGELKRRRKR
jgi:hypothetical protein